MVGTSEVSRHRLRLVRPTVRSASGQLSLDILTHQTRESTTVTQSLFGALPVRYGLGLLRLCTEGRPDETDATALIHFALDQGIRLLDTADSYSLGSKDFHYGERLARQAVDSWHGPSDEVHIITKVGLTRPKGRWVPKGQPDHIRKSVEGSLQALGVDRIFLLQLHVHDPAVPFEDTLGALAELRQEGKVEHLGLCNSSIGEVRQAERHFPVACVQNELSIVSRKSATEGMVALTGEMGIPFLAHRPLSGYAKVEKLAKNRILNPLAERHGATPFEVALATLLDLGDHIVPLIGATKMQSIRSCMNALQIPFDVSDRTAISLKYPFEPDETAQQALTPPTAPVDLRTLEENNGPSDSPEVVLLMGIQGAGKSELVEAYVDHGYARLNRDLIGGKLDDLVPMLREHLQGGKQRVVLDNTYPTRLSRAPVIAAAHACGVPVRCRHLNTPLHEAHINVVLRMLAKYGMPLGPEEMKTFRKTDPTLPPPAAMARWAASYEPAQLNEGFSVVDEIPFVRRVDSSHSEKGLLLDVDGTLRVTFSGEKYPRHSSDVQMIPGRSEILKLWADAGYKLFFVSNQSGVHSGKVSQANVQAALFQTAEMLQVPISEIVFCPHPAFPVGCFCRKPFPGLGVYLMQRHQLDPSALVMVGDMASDEKFASALGARFYHPQVFFSAAGPSPG